MRQVPNWLCKTAKVYWKRLAPQLELTDKTVDALACLCQLHADYRAAIVSGDERLKKQKLDLILKFTKELGLFRQEKKEAGGDEFLDTLTGDK